MVTLIGMGSGKWEALSAQGSTSISKLEILFAS